MAEPRIVFYDIETLPILRQALFVWPQLSNFEGRTLKATLNSVCCFGYKVLGEPEARVICAWDFPDWRLSVNEEGPLLTEVLRVLGDADGIITQNGRAFDEKVLQTRLLLRDMPGLPPIPHEDTKLLAKRFSFFSNSLKYLAEQLTEKRKMENEGWNLWVRVYDRDPEAQEIMREYCKQDVETLAAVYQKLRRAAGGRGPNHNIFQVGGQCQLCPTCGSSRMQKRGSQVTKTMTYGRYQCQDCGAWSRTDVRDRNPRPL